MNSKKQTIEMPKAASPLINSHSVENGPFPFQRHKQP